MGLEHRQGFWNVVVAAEAERDDSEAVEPCRYIAPFAEGRLRGSCDCNHSIQCVDDTRWPSKRCLI
jgi:hypothetical protein